MRKRLLYCEFIRRHSRRWHAAAIFTELTYPTNEGYPDRSILPRWSSYRLRDVKAVIVEEWLRSLPLANGSKAKIRNLMHAVFDHAVRWEWHDKNSITQVRQSAKRQKVPVVLNIEQLRSLLEHLKEPGKTAVLLDILTGLRVSELLALKWSDVDFENLELHVTGPFPSARRPLQDGGWCSADGAKAVCLSDG